MGLELIVCFLSITVGTMIGFYFYQRGHSRERYFDALVNLTNALISDIRFTQRPLSQLIERFLKDNNTPLSQNLEEYLEYIRGDREDLVFTKGLLRNVELLEVTAFFGMLGGSDSQTQIFEIENYKLKFAAYKELEQEYLNKRAKNYVKLGFLFGLALGILLW